MSTLPSHDSKHTAVRTLLRSERDESGKGFTIAYMVWLLLIAVLLTIQGAKG